MLDDLIRLGLLLVGVVGVFFSAAVVVRSDVNVRGARRLARIILTVTLAMPLLVLAGLVFEPAGPTPMFSGLLWYVELLPWAGAAAYVVGLGWMIRIYRADPEPDEPTWRYRT